MLDFLSLAFLSPALLPWSLRLGFGLVGGYLTGGLFAKVSLGSAGNALAGVVGAALVTSALTTFGFLPSIDTSPNLAGFLVTAGTAGLAGTFGATAAGLARRLISPPQPISIL